MDLFILKEGHHCCVSSFHSNNKEAGCNSRVKTELSKPGSIVLSLKSYSPLWLWHDFSTIP